MFYRLIRLPVVQSPFFSCVCKISAGEQDHGKLKKKILVKRKSCFVRQCKRAACLYRYLNANKVYIWLASIELDVTAEHVILYVTDSFVFVTHGVASRGLVTGLIRPLCGPVS